MKGASATAITLLEGRAAGLPPGTRCVDGAQAADEPGLLAAVARALDFPDYFGGNWDALDECLADLSWLPGPATLAFRAAGLVLEQAPARRAVLLRILNDAAASSGLRILFTDQAASLRPWRELCAAERIPFTTR
jgi:hypothetical protein